MPVSQTQLGLGSILLLLPATELETAREVKTTIKSCNDNHPSCIKITQAPNCACMGTEKLWVWPKPGPASPAQGGDSLLHCSYGPGFQNYVHEEQT